MRTIITNFYNEEYLLPWWLKHHREIFDHGILLNDHSNDNSCDIIRALTPDWEIINNDDEEMMFKDPFDLDMRIMNIEKRQTGWKMHLNITEFLCVRNITALEDEIERSQTQEGRPLEGAVGRGVIMVEPHETQPSHNHSLIAQNHSGFFEDLFPNEPAPYHSGDGFLWAHHKSKRFLWSRRKNKIIRLLRSRIYHKRRHGLYTPGRHTSWASQYWNIFRPVRNDMMILWYGLSPWNQTMRERYLHIDQTREPHTRNIQSDNPLESLEKFRYEHIQQKPFDLMTHTDFAATVRNHLW